MNKLKIVTGIITILSLVLTPVAFAAADYLPYNPAPLGDPTNVACLGLALTGMGCSTSGVAVGDYQPKPVTLNFDPFTSASNATSSTSANSATAPDSKTAIANAKAPKDLTGKKINIVSVQNSSEIYELINGQKHAFPSLAVYYDYGYTLSMIQPITQDQLDKFPRATLLKVQGDSKIYYLTEAGLVRQVFDTKKLFDIYGDRPEDVITISRKEFNSYPTNQYVYQISPLNKDVFQVSATGKRYLTPMAVMRLGITPQQIAPVTKAELDSYKTLAPVVD
jgi:hypothetical protein